MLCTARWCPCSGSSASLVQCWRLVIFLCGAYAMVELNKPSEFGAGKQGDRLAVRHATVANSLFDLRALHGHDVDQLIVIP